MRGRAGLLLILLTTITAAGAASSISPGVIDYSPDDNPYRFTIEVTTPGSGPADRIDLEMGSSDPSGLDDLVIARVISVPAGWNATVIQTTDGDNHTLRLTTDGQLRDNESLTVTADLTVRSYPQNHVTVRTPSASEQLSFTADSSPPTITARSPGAGEDRITRTVTTLTATVTDPAGIDADASAVMLNGQRFTTAAPELQFSDGQFSLKTAGLLQEGTNSVSLNLTDDYGHRTTRSYSFTIATSPVIFGETATPAGLIGDSSPDIQIEAADSAGITADSSLSIDGEEIGLSDDVITEIDDAQNRYRITHATSELPDGEYTPTFTIVDGNGNTASHQLRFRIDTTGPTFETGPDINDGDQFTDSITVDVTLADQSSIDEVTATVGDRETELGQTDDDRYTGTIETGGLDGRYTLTVTAEDAAGNTNELSRTVVIDNQPPTVIADGSRLFPTPTNRPPSLTIRSHDATTEPVAAEYFIGTDPGTGEATALDQTGDEGSYGTFAGTVTTAGLENGRYNVTVRVRDELGHWSPLHRIPFLLNRSYSTDITIEQVNATPVRQGQDGQITIQVQNTGRIPGTINASIHGLPFPTQDEQRSVPTGTARTLVIGLAPTTDTRLGNHTATLRFSTRSETIERTINVTITPGTERRQQIAGRISQLRQRYRQLTNRTQAWDQQLEDQRIQQIQQQLEAVQEQLRVTATAVEQGEYLAAYQRVPAITASLEKAEGQLSKAISAHRSTQDRILTLLGLVAALGLGGLAGLLLYRAQTSEGIRLPDGPEQLREQVVGGLRSAITRGEDALDQDLAAMAEQFQQDEKDDEPWSGYDGS